MVIKLSSAALQPGALDWRFFGGILIALVLVLSTAQAIRGRTSFVGRVATGARVWIVGLIVLWLLLTAGAVLLTGMDDIG